MPARGDGPFPLVVILHGLTQSKKSYESHPDDATAENPERGTVEGTGSKYHYNNLWFASKGYMVLTYTARGWKIFQRGDPNDVVSESRCKSYEPQSVDGRPKTMYPGPDPACYIQIAHLKYEIADTRYLIGRLVDGTLTDAGGVKAIRKKIGVTAIDGDVRMLGLPEVSFVADPEHDEMYVAARLWDVDPGPSPGAEDDMQTLVTRGVYRLDGTDPQEVSFKLFGNGYTFPVGHSVKLELTADDSPSFQIWDRQSNGMGTPGTIDITAPSVSIPTASCSRRVRGCDIMLP